MPKVSLITLVSLALCLSSFLSFGYATEDKFYFVGKVYCDTCRVESETKLSEPIKGATVNLECRNETDKGTITHSQDAVTDEDGIYKFVLEGDHDDETCDVSLVKSPRKDCNEFKEASKKARVIVFSKKDGLLEPVRFVNSLGFLKNYKEVDIPACAQALIDSGFVPLH